MFVISAFSLLVVSTLQNQILRLLKQRQRPLEAALISLLEMSNRSDSLTPPPEYIPQPDHFWGSQEHNVTRNLHPRNDPNATRGIPVFKPTYHEFRDFEKYLKSIEPWGMTSGIVKVVPPQEWQVALNHPLLAYAPRHSLLINPCHSLPTGPTHCMISAQYYVMSRSATPSSRIWTASGVCSASATSRSEECSVFANGLNFVLLTTTAPPAWARTVEYEMPLVPAVRGVSGRKRRSV